MNQETDSDARPCVPSKVLLADHVRRTSVALRGFEIFGASWLGPWMSYCVSPLRNRLGRGKVDRFPGFHARRGEADLYTFGSLFEDYPVSIVRRALLEVASVVDLGANVGSFCFLVTALCRRDGLRKRIIAVEPNHENAECLRRQPFAGLLEIEEAAVGPEDGKGRLIRGLNSVTHRADFSATAEGADIRVVSLASLCRETALVKMDIEGGEWEILQGGLPVNVKHLFLEWHPRPGAEKIRGPADLIAGDWKKISSDPYGSSMWYLRQ